MQGRRSSSRVRLPPLAYWANQRRATSPNAKQHIDTGFYDRLQDPMAPNYHRPTRKPPTPGSHTKGKRPAAEAKAQPPHEAEAKSAMLTPDEAASRARGKKPGGSKAGKNVGGSMGLQRQQSGCSGLDRLHAAAAEVGLQDGVHMDPSVGARQTLSLRVAEGRVRKTPVKGRKRLQKLIPAAAAEAALAAGQAAAGASPVGLRRSRGGPNRNNMHSSVISDSLPGLGLLADVAASPIAESSHLEPPPSTHFSPATSPEQEASSPQPSAKGAATHLPPPQPTHRIRGRAEQGLSLAQPVSKQAASPQRKPKGQKRKAHEADESARSNPQEEDSVLLADIPSPDHPTSSSRKASPRPAAGMQPSEQNAGTARDARPANAADAPGDESSKIDQVRPGEDGRPANAADASRNESSKIGQVRPGKEILCSHGHMLKQPGGPPWPKLTCTQLIDHGQPTGPPDQSTSQPSGQPAGQAAALMHASRPAMTRCIVPSQAVSSARGQSGASQMPLQASQALAAAATLDAENHGKGQSQQGSPDEAPVAISDSSAATSMPLLPAPRPPPPGTTRVPSGKLAKQVGHMELNQAILPQQVESVTQDETPIQIGL